MMQCLVFNPLLIVAQCSGKLSSITIFCLLPSLSLSLLVCVCMCVSQYFCLPVCLISSVYLSLRDSFVFNILVWLHFSNAKYHFSFSFCTQRLIYVNGFAKVVSYKKKYQRLENIAHSYCALNMIPFVLFC